jgi:hypothetical protein
LTTLLKNLMLQMAVIFLIGSAKDSHQFRAYPKIIFL